MKGLVFAAVLALGAGPALAAPPAWTVDKTVSRLGFQTTFGGEAFSGAFRRWDAAITFDPKDLAGSKIQVTVDTASAVSGDETRDEALPTDDWFAAKRFPRATFVSRAIRAAGPGRYVADGTLTIRGVSRPASLAFTLAITGVQAKASGTTTVNRSLFGVGQGQFKGPDTIPHNVAVTFNISAKR